MNKVLLLLIFLFTGLQFTQAQNILCSDSLQLREKLSEIRNRDQGDRARIIKDLERKTPEEIKAAALELKISDKKNQLYIAALLDKCGWPKGLSAIDNHTIFLIIDHADTAYMARYFPMLKTQTELGVVSRNDFATLQDRIQLRSGKKQTYGTQTFKAGNVVTVWPVEDMGNLDSRRKAMGLPSMQEYISFLNKTYKSEVLWDKEMTLDEANEKMMRKNKVANR
jgi:hypothetical protein